MSGPILESREFFKVSFNLVVMKVEDSRTETCEKLNCWNKQRFLELVTKSTSHKIKTLINWISLKLRTFIHQKHH